MRTMFQKIWEQHEVVPETADTPAVLYVDRHLIHEVTSPQAFRVLRQHGLTVRRPDRTTATVDHSSPTRTEQIFGGAPIAIESGWDDDTTHEAPYQTIRPARSGSRCESCC